MATMSNDEILDAIGNKTVFELADLIESFKTKFNVTIAAAPAAAAPRPAARPPRRRRSRRRPSSTSSSARPAPRRSRSSRSCAS
jgi:large subunit ribosomal protein L7/L12